MEQCPRSIDDGDNEKLSSGRLQRSEYILLAVRKTVVPTVCFSVLLSGHVQLPIGV